MLGLALVATAAIGGFALGMYRHNAESAPTPPATVAATAEEPERVEEPESTEEPTSLEKERKRQIAPTVAESVTVEAPAPMANVKPERARPARMPKRMSRQPARKAAEARRQGGRTTTEPPGTEPGGNHNAISQTAMERSGDCATADRTWIAGFGRSDC